MAPRKSHSNESPATETARSSMRRLSSIASLHHLLPFAKTRRSQGTIEDGVQSTSSQISLATSDFNEQALSSSTIEEDCSHLQPTQLADPSLPRSNTYVCLPDDPIGGMPRSRTFSNLPLPARVRRSRPQTPPRSHVMPPTTRLPTPTSSTRHYLTNTRNIKTSKAVQSQGRLQRSDTEPLLVISNQAEIQRRRPTVFKENLAGTVKPENQWPLQHAMSSSIDSSHLSEDDSDRLINKRSTMSRDERFAKNLPSTNLRGLISRDVATVAQEQPQISKFQRWKSQPRLTEQLQDQAAGQSRSQAIAKAPQKLLPTSTNVYADTHAGHSDKENIDWSSKFENRSCYTPEVSRSRTSHLATFRDVWTAEPPAYWAGRLSTLVDKARNAELTQHTTGGVQRSRIHTDALYVHAANVEHVRSALSELHDLCKTQDARDSLAAFQLQYASLQDLPDLARPVGRQSTKPAAVPIFSLETPEHSDANSAATAGIRKVSFVKRLLGRRNETVA